MVYLIGSSPTIPAGIETSVLTAGISFARNTPVYPFSLIHPRHLSTDSICLGKCFFMNFSKGFPPKRPSRYSISLPKTPAAVDTSSVTKKLLCPLEAMTPASGIMIPAGKPGKLRYSKNTITNTASRPYCEK